MHWYAVDLILTPEAREAAEYALSEAGALGTESHAGAGPDGQVVEGDFLRVTGYFDVPPRVERVREALLEALRVYGHESSVVREMRPREVEERDWLAEWKKSWRPVEVGRRFVVAPPWSVVEGVGDGRLVIRIEPGMAFGTGTHETTRLCLVAIEEHFDGLSFLDVGTGTGVLAIAAALICPEACVEACDTDPSAVTIAHENAVRNGVAERVNLRVGSVGEDAARADFVCANLTAEAIIPLLRPLLDAARRRLVLSGILATQTDAVVARLKELDPRAAPQLKTDGEWAAIILSRT
ncbi:MAG TPA: 50S ribosomal protein L11 methyltransferase [Pyrinomonadaceae bacterium]|nr:50S ribosomal protein L11 methyltransferase [Pyrinomonadaceae bacterium]